MTFEGLQQTDEKISRGPNHLVSILSEYLVLSLVDEIKIYTILINVFVIYCWFSD